MDTLLKNLKANHMSGYYVKDKAELLTLLEELLPKEITIGSGDSVTLEVTGVFDFLRRGNYHFYDKHDSLLTKEEKRRLYIHNFDADVFITSSNAVTKSGKIFNIDGNGSRVAPIIYGPKKVIIVIGKNKIVPTVEDAIRRTREIAAPNDAKRLKKTNTLC